MPAHEKELPLSRAAVASVVGGLVAALFPLLAIGLAVGVFSLTHGDRGPFIAFSASLSIGGLLTVGSGLGAAVAVRAIRRGEARGLGLAITAGVICALSAGAHLLLAAVVWFWVTSDVHL